MVFSIGVQCLCLEESIMCKTTGLWLPVQRERTNHLDWPISGYS